MSKQQLQSSQAETEIQSTTQVQQNNGVSNSDQQQKIREAQYRAQYEQALGDALGGRLYDSVSDLITMDQMVRYGKDLVDSLLDAAVSAASDASQANLNDEAQEKVVGGLEALLDPLVARMIQSEIGQSLVAKLQHTVGSNPHAIAGVGILAAAAAVLSDMDIPTLEPKLKLGGGFSANASLDVGSLRNIALGATKLGLSYKRENITAGIDISRSKDGALGGEVSGKLGDDKRHIKGSVALSEDGITAFEIGGAIGLSPNTNLSGNANGSNLEQIPNWEVQISSKQGDFTHTGDLQYNSSSKDLFAKYTGQSERMIYYASLRGNSESDSLSNFNTGFRYTPDKGDVYSADYKYNFQNESHQLDMIAQERMGDFSLRGHQRLQYGNDTGLQSNTELMAAYHMGTDLSLIGGADIQHNGQTGETITLPKMGIQYNDIPIVLSYNPQTKSTSVGITLKF